MDVELRDRLRRIEYKINCLGSLAIGAVAATAGTIVASELRAYFVLDKNDWSVAATFGAIFFVISALLRWAWFRPDP